MLWPSSIAFALTVTVPGDAASLQEACASLPPEGAHEIVITEDIEGLPLICGSEQITIRSDVPGVLRGICGGPSCLFFTSGDIVLRDLQIDTFPGPAVEMLSEGTLFVDSVLFVGPGRGIEAEGSGGMVTVEDSVFMGLNSGGRGGAIRVVNRSLTLSHSEILGCSSASGAVFVDGAEQVQIEDTVFRENVALYGPGGGAVYINDVLEVQIVDSLFDQNESLAGSNMVIFGGGAVHVDSSTEAVLRQNSFCFNSATQYGGAVLVRDGAAVVDYNLFALNSAVAGAGAMQLRGQDTTLVATHNTLVANSSPNPILDVSDGTATSILHNLFYDNDGGDLFVDVAANIDNAHYRTDGPELDGASMGGLVFNSDPSPAAAPTACDGAPILPGMSAALLNAASDGSNYGAYQDVDLDGVDAPFDCADGDPAVRPNSPEVCNGLDDNCDGVIDTDALDALEFWFDSDGDGVGGPESMLLCSSPFVEWTRVRGDCNDADPRIAPGRPEVCNGVDDNCDRLTDGEDPNLVDGLLFFEDLDGDGYGTDAHEAGCVLPDGYADEAGDCDDSDPTVHPYAEEIPGDGVDQDCSGSDAQLTEPIRLGLACSSVRSGWRAWPVLRRR